MVERYLLLLAAGLVVAFVAHTTPDVQPFLCLCGGVLIGTAVSGLIKQWRGK